MFNILERLFSNQYAAINPIFVYMVSPFFAETKLTGAEGGEKMNDHFLCRIRNEMQEKNLVIISSVVLHTKYLFDNTFWRKQNDAVHWCPFFICRIFMACVLSRTNGQRTIHKAHLLSHSRPYASASFIVSNYPKMSIDILKVELLDTKRPMRISNRTISTSYDMHGSNDKCQKRYRIRQIDRFYLGILAENKRTPICSFACFDEMLIVRRDGMRQNWYKIKVKIIHEIFERTHFSAWIKNTYIFRIFSFT